MAKQTYPETALLKQVKGVGDLIATFGLSTSGSGCYVFTNRPIALLQHQTLCHL
ncbi:MAG: hypothetical protein WAK48_01400 [Candidatus Acidiferrum sp.]|jgi:hypothetical protein